MELSRFLKIYPDPGTSGSALIYSTLRGTVLKVSGPMLEAISSGALEPSELQALARVGVMVPDAVAEQEQVAGYFDWANARANRFTAMVTLNLDCNLACPYCYERHFRDRHYMTKATADLLVERVLKGPIREGREIILDFYGGEALLSTPLIRRISEPLKAASKSAGTPFSFNLVTNGTLLTRRVVDELIPLGLRGVKVTIDGPPDIHDVQRPFITGRGSFNTILKNLGEICGLLQIQIGGNFTRANFFKFPELLDILIDSGITPDKVYTVQFSPVTPAACEAGMGDFSMGCACSSEPWLIDASLHLREEILKRGWNTPKPKLAGCMVEFTHDLVVAWDGGLFKCPAFMGWDDLRIGTLADGIGAYGESHGMDLWRCRECLQCPYLPLCFGGCRFMRRLNTGAIDGVDCRRTYLDAALETIVRQDLDLGRR